MITKVLRWRGSLALSGFAILRKRAFNRKEREELPQSSQTKSGPGCSLWGQSPGSLGDALRTLRLKPLTAKNAKNCRKGRKANHVLGGRAFHFYSGPLLEQGQRGRVVEVSMAIFGGHFVDFFNGFQAWQLGSNFFCRF